MEDAPKKAAAKDAGKTAAIDKLKPGDAIQAAFAPPVGNRPFTVTCRVETAQRDAIIVAHGGNAAGYALHLKDGRVVFSVRTGKEAVTDVTSGPVAGPLRIAAILSRDGTMTLTVGDQPPVTAKAPGLIPRQPAEEFCVGHDNAQPVAVYSNKGAAFKGTIADLKVTSP
jgi:hypothetical protein